MLIHYGVNGNLKLYLTNCIFQVGEGVSHIEKAISYLGNRKSEVDYIVSHVERMISHLGNSISLMNYSISLKEIEFP